MRILLDVIHKENGPLEIDASTGCPEVQRELAESLIEHHRKLAQARVAAISRRELEGSTNAELIQIMQQGKCETEAAMRVFAKRLFNQAQTRSVNRGNSKLSTHGREVLMLE